MRMKIQLLIALRGVALLLAMLSMSSESQNHLMQFTINGNPSWIEITDAFFSPELAESITTHVANDKQHRPVPKEKRICIDPDEKFSSILESVIVTKYDKDSIGNVYKQYGSGILLVGIINPFSSAKDLAVTEKKKIEEAVKAKEPRFSDIYLYDVHDHAFHKVL